MTLSLVTEPKPHWWEASALTTTPVLNCTPLFFAIFNFVIILYLLYILFGGLLFLFVDPQFENQDLSNVDTHGNKVYPEFPI